MTAMQPYLIRLQPLAPFYFGSERNFGTGEDTNYFARSRQTPQQTTLLGVLRYKLLEAHDALSKSHQGGKVDAIAADLVGRQSFMGNAKFDPNTFGKIGGISPVFLLHDPDQRIYLPANLDDGFSLVKKSGKSACVKLAPEDGKPLLGVKNHTIQLDGYDPKKPPDAHWANDLGGRVKADDLFKKAEQVGVFKLHGRDKSHRSQHIDPDDEDGQKGFFKKISWSFAKPGFGFGFVAYLEKAAGDKLASHVATNANVIAHVGGERSSFRMTAEAADAAFIARWENGKFYSAAGADGQLKVILLSDAFADLSLYNFTDFSLAEPVEFRNLQATVDQTAQYFGINRNGNNKGAPRKSVKRHLFAPGSVFYVNNWTEFRKCLVDDALVWRQIGYNHFAVVNATVSFDFFKP